MKAVTLDWFSGLYPYARGIREVQQSTRKEMQLNWNDMRPDELPGDLGEIATDIGLEAAQYLVEVWGGSMIYVPTLSKLKKEHRDRMIVVEYNGGNVGTLAVRLGVSRRYVRKVLKENDADL